MIIKSKTWVNQGHSQDADHHETSLLLAVLSGAEVVGWEHDQQRDPLQTTEERAEIVEHFDAHFWPEQIGYGPSLNFAYRPLYFEQACVERYGCSFGYLLQPLLVHIAFLRIRRAAAVQNADPPTAASCLPRSSRRTVPEHATAFAAATPLIELHRFVPTVRHPDYQGQPSCSATESFSGNNEPWGKRALRKRLPTPSAKRDSHSFADPYAPATTPLPTGADLLPCDGGNFGFAS